MKVTDRAQLGRRLQQLSEAELSRTSYGSASVSGAHMKVALFLILANGEKSISANGLAARSGMSERHMSRVVRALMKLGFVHRDPREHDPIQSEYTIDWDVVGWYQTTIPICGRSDRKLGINPSADSLKQRRYQQRQKEKKRLAAIGNTIDIKA